MQKAALSARWKHLRTIPLQRRKWSYVFYSSFNKSSFMAFICFETGITSKRKTVQSYAEDSPFPSWKGEVKFFAKSSRQLCSIPWSTGSQASTGGPIFWQQISVEALTPDREKDLFWFQSRQIKYWASSSPWPTGPLFLPGHGVLRTFMAH